MKPPRPHAKCHPRAFLVAHGMCRNCYQAWWAKEHPEYNPNNRKQNATCHPDQKMVAKGMCKRCYQRYYSMSHTYGITWDQYREMESRQGNLCAICRKPFAGTRLHVDHCHSTGKVRGLLCNRCNNGIGCMNDDVSLLEKAIEYLKVNA